MRLFNADLQMHSCLSPCGSLESSPGRLARAARARGLDIIALTDHNTADNCPALAAYVSGMDGVVAFFGTEVTTAEEVHLVCLFGQPDVAVEFGACARMRLPRQENDPERFGDQPVVDAAETILRIEAAFLVGATAWTIDDVVRDVHGRHGVVVASHIDRPINSLFSQLGMWPTGCGIDACDLSPRADAAAWRARVPAGIPFVRTSDAHFPEDVGRQRTVLRMEDPTFNEFCRALKAEDGRAVLIDQAASGIAAIPPHAH